MSCRSSGLWAGSDASIVEHLFCLPQVGNVTCSRVGARLCHAWPMFGDGDPRQRVSDLMVTGDPRWRVEDMRLRRCNNCGLLGQLRLVDRELVPMLEEFRGRDGSFADFVPLKRDYERMPICAASARTFKPYVKDLDIPRWNQLLSEDMSACKTFTQWIPGLSIREHQERLDRQNALEREDRRDAEMRDREDRRDAAQRQWQLDLVAMQHGLATDLAQQAWKKEDARSGRELWVVGGVVTAFLVAATLAGSMIQAGWIPQPW